MLDWRRFKHIETGYRRARLHCSAALKRLLMENLMNRRIAHVLCSVSLLGQLMPATLAASQPELNFKIYSPPDAAAPPASTPAEPKTTSPTESKKSEDKSSDSMWSGTAETPAADPSADAAVGSSSSTTPTPTPTTTTTTTDSDAKPAADTTSTTGSTDATPAADAPAATSTEGTSRKVLQGYIRVVPSGTKVPIIMDTAIDTDTSQEGDEFAARTSEDLTIDGSTVVPAGSVIKGRIAGLNAPRSLNRSGSVALKFDTVTTPDNRQIPLVANLVARGGVVHARRGLKDIAIDTGTFALPTALGLGIGVLAGSAKGGSNSDGSSSKMNAGTGALIGAGVGAAVGVAILCIKKGKKVDVRPGDELKIELAEDLRMPM